MKDSEPTKTSPGSATTVALLVTLVDTTWRMLIPSAVFVALGLFADRMFNTGPWLTLFGLVAGLGSSTALIVSQLRRPA